METKKGARDNVPKLPRDAKHTKTRKIGSNNPFPPVLLFIE